jgi:hypothetical protein
MSLNRSTNTNPAPQEITPQLPVAGIRIDTLRQQIPTLRTEIQPEDTIIPFRQIPERFRQQIYRPAPPPPQLTAQDSITLNLKGNSGVSLNWHLEFNREFDSSAFSWIDDNLFETESEETEPFHSDSLILEAPIASQITETPYFSEVPEIHKDVHLEKPALQQDWFLAILILSVLTTGIIRINWFRYLKDVLQSVFFSSLVSKLSGYNASNFLPSLILSSLFYFNSSIFVYQILTETNRQFMGNEGSLALLLVLVFLLVLFSAKVIVYKALGYIFGTSRQINEYILNSNATSKAFGLFILPVIIFIPFVEPDVKLILIKSGIGLFIVLYLMQIVRGVKSNLNDLLSVYYIILYLCALEILPLTILFKVLFK